MNNQASLRGYLRRGISRRSLIQGTMAAGAVFGSGVLTTARADDDEQDARSLCGQALPITHTQPNPFGVPIHVYFPGPIDGSAFPLTDPLGTHAEGRDPSTITNFSGFVGQVDLVFSGTGTDTKTGATAAYSFHTDSRFIQGKFIGADEQKHSGTFAFIWIDSLAAASPLGLHSYDPGISQTLAVWTTPIPEDSVEVDLNKGEALLKLESLCSVFDAFTVPNSFDPLHALGFVGAVIRSLRIRWKGITTTRSFSNGSTFRANSVETSATIDVTVETPATKPPFTPSPRDGFRFIADPSSTVTHFAQLVHENNGTMFWRYFLTNEMRGLFVENNKATIAVKATTPKTAVTALLTATVSDPASTSVSHFAEIGTESDGVFF